MNLKQLAQVLNEARTNLLMRTVPDALLFGADTIFTLSKGPEPECVARIVIDGLKKAPVQDDDWCIVVSIPAGYAGGQTRLKARPALVKDGYLTQDSRELAKPPCAGCVWLVVDWGPDLGVSFSHVPLH